MAALDGKTRTVDKARGHAVGSANTKGADTSQALLRCSVRLIVSARSARRVGVTCPPGIFPMEPLLHLYASNFGDNGMHG